MIEIYTDGSCQRNPGRGGWGIAWVKDNMIYNEQYGGEELTTNNRMELYAVIKALETLSELTERPSVIIYTDSTYVYKGITSWRATWKKNGWKTSQNKPVLNMDLWLDIDKKWLSDVDIRWVKGHSGCPKNDRADQLAKKGCLGSVLS